VRAFIDYRGATPEKVKSGIPLVTAANIRNGHIEFDSVQEFIPERDYDAWMVRGLPEIGDVLLTTEAPLGEVAQITHCRIALAQRVILLKADSRFILSDYLKFYFLSDVGNFQLATRATGSTAIGIKASHLRAVPVLVPPLDEQRRIVSLLDRQTARLDALIEKKERLITLLEEKRAAMINRAVTKGLDLSAPMKDSGIPWLGEIPANWEVKRLLHLTPTDRPVMYGIVLPGPNVEDGVPVVKGGDVAPGRLRLVLLNRTTREIESGYVRSRLKAGDIVYAIRGSIGSVELVPEELCGANLTQDAARVSPKPDVDGCWLLYALRAQCAFGQVDASAMGATIRGVNIRDLKRVILAVPPLKEQSEIASYLSRAISTLDEIIFKTREQIAKFQEYRTALISAAVTGKIDVRGSAQV
jgi:type I restriction enzyme S subunit